MFASSKKGIPTLSIRFEHEDMPGVYAVQIAADSRSVTVAYLNLVGNAIKVKEFSVPENPELNDIVKFTYFDDVWDMELVLFIIDPVNGDEPAPALMPLVSAYLQSLQAAS